MRARDNRPRKASSSERARRPAEAKATASRPVSPAMPAGLERLNRLPPADAKAELLKVCGSLRWAERMARARPFLSVEGLYSAADALWSALDREDWLQAFSHHPRIGDPAVLRAKLAADWAGQEQSGVRRASDAIIEALAEGNRDYEAKFGHVFIVCATGKTADELISLLNARLRNDAGAELKIAAGEHAKINRIRLENLMKATSPITTHVLDIAKGFPAAGVPVMLEAGYGKEWKILARGTTDADGRVADLLPPGPLSPGAYRLTFDTAAYLSPRGERGFYPCIQVIFEVQDASQHYHIPLLLSPFGYSTYRGS